jgi:isopentenyl phosphate kinase
MLAVKLGGSVLTNKGARGRPRYRARVAHRLARELTRGAAGRPLLVIHGGGAYGHPAAKRAGIGGRLQDGRVPAAFDRVAASMQELRAKVLDSLRRAGLKVVSVPASAAAFSSSEGLYWEIEALQAFAERGLVPVTGGDVVLDERAGVRILSGDEIMAHVSRALKPERAVFVTDVDGLLDDGRLIGSMKAAQLEARRRRTPRGDDATGGMRGKLEQIQAITARGVPVDIVNGNRPGRLQALLAGRDVPATRVTAEA